MMFFLNNFCILKRFFCDNPNPRHKLIEYIEDPAEVRVEVEVLTREEYLRILYTRYIGLI